MRVVQCLYIAAGPTTLESLAPARPLEDESPILCQKFRKALFESPKGFKYAVQMEGFPTVHLEWIPVGQTSVRFFSRRLSRIRVGLDRIY